MPNTQVQTFLNKVADIPSDVSHGAPDKSPGMAPFKTALKLTLAQEQKLLFHCLNRIDQMISESGRATVTQAGDWYQSLTQLPMEQWTFMGRRGLFEMTYQNRVEWRKSCIGGIFRDSNETATHSRRVCRQMTARACNYYFGTDPWFSAFPIGGNRKDLADEIEAFTQFKVEKAGLKSVLALAIEGATYRGEEVVKTVWENNDQIYECNCNVLLDVNGQPAMDVNGDVITDEDRFTPELTPAQLDQVTGVEQPRMPTGRNILQKDLTTPEPQIKQYQQMTVKRRKTIYKGPRSEIVYWRDLLMPGNAKCIQTSDIVCQLSDMPVMKLVSMYQNKGLISSTPDEEDSATKRALTVLRNMAGSGPFPKTALGMAHVDKGENPSCIGLYGQEPIAQIAECYVSFDANEDGTSEEIMCVIDRTNKQIIFYDYLANVTPDGERPFDVVKIQDVNGRWYGIGAMEMFETSQRAIDKMLNRQIISVTSAGRVTFWDPSAVLEGDRNNNLVMNMGGTYMLKAGKKAEDACSFVTLPETQAKDMIEIAGYFAQLITNEGGVANANDSSAAGMETSKLATGVNNIKASGEEMTSLYMSCLLPSLTGVLRRHIKLLIAHMNPQEVYTFFDGDQAKTGILLAEDLADVDVDCDILLITYRGEQLLTSTQQACNISAQFYQYPPFVQQKVAPLYRQLLKALKIDNADEIIVPMDPQQPAPSQPGQQPDTNQPPQGQPSLPNGAQVPGPQAPPAAMQPQPSAPQISGKSLLVSPTLQSRGPELPNGTQ